ncbi:Eco47II family restriction endonuclease [Francisella philomiragia]|uniref:Eco47II family restriction endonuclease n=1 Tax=Francisella philomiragia TaxID=28110 RepID=UPI00351469CB
MNYNLSFISNENLFNHVKDTVEKYRFDIDLKQFNKNLIDPIKLTFDSKVYSKSIKDIVELEVIRQMDKSNSNNIGYFQQNIFKYLHHKDNLASDWTVPSKGFDIVNNKNKIFVEMKNKHNTMNSSSSQKTFMRMQSQILKDSDSKCFLVEVIAKNSQDIIWKVSLDEVSTFHPNIRRVSIDKFYEIVTGEKQAFKHLVEVLPKVLDDVLNSIDSREIENTVFKELSEIDSNIAKSLYLLSFKEYEGFDELDIAL